MKTLSNIRKDLDKIPLLLTFALVLFLDGLFGGFYRLTKGTKINIAIGILWCLVCYVPLIFGPFGTVFTGVLTLIDLFSVTFFGKIKVLA